MTPRNVTAEDALAQHIAEMTGDDVERTIRGARVALAALRDAGFDVYRPDDHSVVTVEEWWIGNPRMGDRLTKPEPGIYRLVPVETPKENQ